MISKSSKHRHLETTVLLALLALFGLTSLSFLGRFPKVWMDEGWDSTTAYTFQKVGAFRNLALVSAALGNQDVHFLQPRILPNIVMAPFFSLLGVGSVQGRLASVLMGALGVIGVYVLSRRIGNVVFAVVCTVFFIFDNLFFVVTRTIRPEIYVTTLAIWALYLALNPGTSSWKPLLSGFLLGASLYAHPNAFLVLVAIVIIVLFQVETRRFKQVLLPMALGIVMGFLPYALYVGYQDGANQFRDFWLQIHERAGILTRTSAFLSQALVAEAERYTSYLFFPYRLMIFLMQIAALGYAAFRRSDRFSRPFLVFVAVQLVLFPILISEKSSRYFAVLMPVVTILVVKMLWGIAGWSTETALPALRASVLKVDRRIAASIILALIYLGNQTGGDAWAVWQSRDCAFGPFIAQVRGLVPAGARVWGPMTYWFGFYDYSYRTPYTIDNYDKMSEFRPDFVILYDNSEIWGNEKGVTKRYDPIYDANEPIRNMLTQLVDARGVSAGSVVNSCYGDIEIFKLIWG